MFKALLLDLRANPTRNIVFGALTLIGLITGVTVGLWFFAHIFAASWIAWCVAPHRSMDAGPFAELQAVVGVPRKDAVRAKFVILTLVAAFVVFVALVGLVVDAGVATEGVQILVPLVAAVVAIAAVNLTLGYTASRSTQQSVTILLAAALAAVAFAPMTLGLPDPGSNAALSTVLWSPPVPLGLVLVALASVTLLVGERLAQRAYATVSV